MAVKKDPLKVSERDLQRQIIGLARVAGFRVMHSRPARVKCRKCRGQGCARCTKGETWRTALEGDAGFFDLVLVHEARRRAIFFELKSEDGECSDEQLKWLGAMQAVAAASGGSVVVEVARPSDWARVEDLLLGRA